MIPKTAGRLAVGLLIVGMGISFAHPCNAGQPFQQGRQQTQTEASQD